MPSYNSYYKGLEHLLDQFEIHIGKLDSAISSGYIGLVAYYHKEIKRFHMQIEQKFTLVNPNQERTIFLRDRYQKLLDRYSSY